MFPELPLSTGSRPAAYEHLHSSHVSIDSVVQQASSSGLSETFRDEIFHGIRKQEERSVEADYGRGYELDSVSRQQKAVDKVIANALGSLNLIEDRRPSLKKGNGWGNHAAGKILVLVKTERGSLCERKKEKILEEWVSKQADREHRLKIQREVTYFLGNPGTGRLELGDLDLTSCPDFFYQKPFVCSLYKLCLNRNNFGEFPEEVTWLECLECLDLSNNYLTSVPASISRLCCLEYLDLANNCFTSVPDSISQLPGLRFLNLSNNHLEFLPERIGQLELTSRPKSVDSSGQSRIVYTNLT